MYLTVIWSLTEYSQIDQRRSRGISCIHQFFLNNRSKKTFPNCVHFTQDSIIKRDEDISTPSSKININIHYRPYTFYFEQYVKVKIRTKFERDPELISDTSLCDASRPFSETAVLSKFCAIWEISKNNLHISPLLFFLISGWIPWSLKKQSNTFQQITRVKMWATYGQKSCLKSCERKVTLLFGPLLLTVFLNLSSCFFIWPSVETLR